MKLTPLCTALLLAASSVFAAEDAKQEVKNAAKKLAADSYSWKSTVAAGEGAGNRFRAGPTEGKIQKDGLTMLSMTRGENTTEAILKGEKGAIKGEDGWQSLSEAGEAGEGQRNRGRFLARTLQTFKAPAVEAGSLVDKTKTLTKAGDVYSGDLTPEGVKELLSFGRRREGSEPPAVSGAKGTAKFWVKDGVLTKYEYNVKGSMTFNENDVEIDRTTTVEIKDSGKTEVKAPEEALKKLS